MKEKSTGTGAESRPTWESLEALARQGVQRLLQQLLEEEVEQVVGRRRYERRDGVDAAPGYRNGLGKPRRLSTMTGTITIRRPRLRGLEARFEIMANSAALEIRVLRLQPRNRTSRSRGDCFAPRSS